MASTRELQGKKQHKFPNKQLNDLQDFGENIDAAACLQLHQCNSEIQLTNEDAAFWTSPKQSPALQTSSHTVKMFLLCEWCFFSFYILLS